MKRVAFLKFSVRTLGILFVMPGLVMVLALGRTGNAYAEVYASQNNVTSSTGAATQKAEPLNGCVSVPRSTMTSILRKVRTDCVVVIDKESKINNY